MKSYSIAIVESDTAICAHLRNAFFRDPHVHGVQAFPSSADLLTLAGHSPPDIIFLSSTITEGSLSDAVQTLKQQWPGAPVIIVVPSNSPPLVVEAICANGNGCLTADTSTSELIRQAHTALEGGAAFSGATANALSALVREHVRPAVSPGEATVLTGRELDVLRLLAAGNSYKEVANRLDVSVDTIRTHVRSLYRKMNVHSATGAITKALRERLV